jgi:outer membrane protein TolC
MGFAFRNIAAVVIALFIVISSGRADDLTLDDCIELALNNRASIIAAMGRESAASAEKRAALGAFLPRVNASYTYSKSKETDIKFEQEVFGDASDTLFIDAVDSTPGGAVNTVIGLPYGPSQSLGIQQFTAPDQDRTNKSLQFSANMPLIDPAVWFTYGGARADHKTARLNVLASEQDLIYSVKVVYFAYLAAVQNVTVQEEAVKRAEEQLKLIQSRFDLGSASKSDVLKQKVQYGNDRLALLTARNTVTNAKADLAFTIGVDPRKDWSFSTEYSSLEYEGTLEEAIDFGLDHKPSLLASRSSVNAAENYLRSARMDYLPAVYGFASYTFSDGTRGDTVAFDQSSRSRTLGFQVTYNIFDGFSRESRIAQNKVAVNNTKAELADARNQTVSDIKTAYLDIEQIREQKSVADENVLAADEDLKITQEKYKLGAATILDLLDAQVSLKQAQVAAIRADFDFNLAIAKLENAMGKM